MRDVVNPKPTTMPRFFPCGRPPQGAPEHRMPLFFVGTLCTGRGQCVPGGFCNVQRPALAWSGGLPTPRQCGGGADMAGMSACGPAAAAAAWCCAWRDRTYYGSRRQHYQ